MPIVWAELDFDEDEALSSVIYPAEKKPTIYAGITLD